jgi:hypothetical protein
LSGASDTSAAGGLVAGGAVVTVSVDLLDPRHDPAPPDYGAFVAHQDLYAFWAYELLRVFSWHSWSPILLGVVRDGGEIIGLVCAVWMMPHRARFAPAHGGSVPRVVDVRMPGNGFTPSWHFVPGLSDADRAAMMRVFERAAMRRLGPTCLGVVYRQAWESSLPMLRGGRGWRPVRRPVRPTAGAAVLEIPWSSYDGWLGSLTGKRRGELRRQVRRVRENPELTIRFDFGREAIDAEAVARLIREQDRRLRGGHVTRVWAPPTYRRMLAARKDVGMLTYEDSSGRMLACGTLLVVSSAAVIGWWGSVPVAEGGRRHLWFDMHCRFVEWAIEHGRGSLNTGRGALTLKAELGFREIPMYAVVAPRWLS